ncbi:glucose-6-phosphate dehydrogenase [Agrilactobacillus fermenti]|uniref:glucose-6-phosphate dehydrogenase n=1 Tax=Agrilactobacillus fermenti TaxID=2586909 RepID=UPI001E45A088|nr:glucose-6-phosphate dehydrogenase [Agrilactobacillus fermenti]
MENNSENQALIYIFGGSGDLAHRKLYPALFNLYRKDHIKHNFAVIGTARRDWSDDYYRDTILKSLTELPGSYNQKIAFTKHFYYQSHDVTDSNHYVTLRQLGDELDQKYHTQGNRVFYMAMAPKFFATIADHIKSEDLLSDQGFNRLVIEKPFGRDYESAKNLNDAISKAFKEEQIYRIDHYLGKEMVLGLLPMRFTNPMFEQVWNKQFIDNIQITLFEALGVEDRAGYYETAGALRDMVQNHVMQILALTTLERPDALNAADIRDKKRLLFQALKPYTPEQVDAKFVRGQYGASDIPEHEPAYRQENNVDPKSPIETFVAGEIDIDNDQWSGVPIYIRTGKRTPEKRTRIDIVFKPSANQIFDQPAAANILTIDVEPSEGVTLQYNGKKVGQTTTPESYLMSYHHSKEMLNEVLDAYERLILDVLVGDNTNFSHWHELEATWQFVDAIRQRWDSQAPTDFPNYKSGTAGPQAADELLAKTGRHWIYQPTDNTKR